jgi:hypothetical protein
MQIFDKKKSPAGDFFLLMDNQYRLTNHHPYHARPDRHEILVS